MNILFAILMTVVSATAYAQAAPGADPATAGDSAAAAATQAQAEPDPEALREYAGTYPLMPGFDLAVRERDGGLHAQATGQGEFPLTHASDDVFQATAYGIEIRFARDAGGTVSSLELHQGGHVLSGDRR